MQVITQQQAGERRYAECAMCNRSTENGCIRALRVELKDARGRRVDEVLLLDEIFCSENCGRIAASSIVEEINNDSDPELLSDYKRWKGHVAGFSIGFARIGLVPSADE